MESNRNVELIGNKPKTKQNGIQPKPRVERYQTEIRNRIEPNRHQQLRGIKPKTEIGWNQTETNS
jgi:hypothetical protein